MESGYVPGVPYGDFLAAESYDEQQLRAYIADEIVPNTGKYDEEGRLLEARTASQTQYNHAFNRLRNIYIEKFQQGTGHAQTQAKPWPKSLLICGGAWQLKQKEGFFIYESPTEVRTSQKFGKVRHHSHVRLEKEATDKARWDGKYHVTFYVKCDGSCPGKESGDSLCFHTYFVGDKQLNVGDDNVTSLNRPKYQNTILRIASEFWQNAST